MSFLRGALERITVRAFFLLCAGDLAALLLGLVWLKIPDSHVWQLVVSVLLGALVVGGFLLLQVFSIQGLRRAVKPLRLWLASLLLVAWLLLFALLVRLAGHLNDHISERAGFWNSRFGPHLRNMFSYNRLVSWQTDLVSLLLWIILPALFLPWIVESVSNVSWARLPGHAGRLLRDWRHWLAMVVIGGLLLWITPTLLYWHPVDSIGGEIVSALFRLPLVFLVDVGLLLFLLAIEAELLARLDAGRHTIAEPAPERL